MRPDPQHVSHVACIGAGTIGAGWAAYFLSRGLSVAVTDPGAGAEALLHRIIDESWPSLEALGLPAGADPGKVKFFPTVAEAVKGAEFVQESAPDRLELKTALLAEVDGFLPPDIVIASSTSTFLPSALGAKCKHPERIIVGHPFAPAHLLPLVEVVGSETTPPAVLDWACAFYAALGKRPLRLKKEIQSFIANRLQYAIQDEANRLIDAGVCDYADIDTAVTQGIGLRWAFMGPAMCAHLGGGKGGLKHRLEHLGWHGSDATKKSLSAAVGDIAGATPMDDLERWRDANLVAQRRALKRLEK
jgi:3-hydroxyacyl-CoA dehydrogenase